MKARILVVEDNPRIIIFLTDALEGWGYEVLLASDGLEGLQIARETKPDLIVLDVMMPKMDGYEVCSHLRADPETWPIPVLMLTAKGQREDIVRGLEIGADDYLPKPYDNEVLKARIQSLLRRYAKNRLSSDSSNVDKYVYFTKLYEGIIASFDREEFQTLCFGLGVDYDELRGDSKNGKVRELILYLDRRNIVPGLVSRLKELRPSIKWIPGEI